MTDRDLGFGLAVAIVVAGSYAMVAFVLWVRRRALKGKRRGSR